MNYLTYEEYTSIGGVLDVTAFNRNIDRACAVIDSATFNRIHAMSEVPQRVKACCRDLAEYYATNANSSEKGVASWSQTAGAVNESVTYTTQSADDMQSAVGGIISDYLGSVDDDNGTPLLYLGGELMKIGFETRFGYNEIEIPITDETKPKFRPYGMADKFTKKVTIYNDIPKNSVEDRHFDRFVIDRCLIYNQLAESANGTINKTVNTQNVITKDIEHYRPPNEYKKLAGDEREKYYTVQVNDFVVLAEVDDVVTTTDEWSALQKKYKDNGFSVTSANASVYGMNVDNVHIMHA